MTIIEVATRNKKVVVIGKAVKGDFKLLVKKRFSFAWSSFQHSTTIYKLKIENDNAILGVMGLIDWPQEKK